MAGLNDYSGVLDSVSNAVNAYTAAEVKTKKQWKFRQRDLALQQKYNIENMQRQFEYSKRAFDMENAYNDPRNAVARWRGAGIAPQAVFGSSPGGSGVAGSMSTPDSSSPGSGPDYGFAPVISVAEMAAMRNQQRLTDAEVNLKNAQATEARSRTTGQDIENSMSDLLKRARAAAAGIAEAEKTIKEIEAKWLDREKAKDMQVKDGILEEIGARVDKLVADKDFQERATEKLKSDMDLIKAQIDTESSKQRNLDADTGYKKSLRETENILRSGRVKIQQTEARKLIEDAFGSRLKNVEIAEQLARIISGADRSSSLYSVLDKAIESIGTREKDEKDNLRNRFLEDLRNFVSLHE